MFLLNLKKKILRIIGISLTTTGIIFLLTSNYIGSIAIRIAIIGVMALLITNIKMTYKYITTKEKINYVIALALSVLVLLKPEFTMFIIGIFLLFLTVPVYYNAIKTRDYSDVIVLVTSGIGMLFGLYCIINSKAALNTVIIIIGISFVALGCVALYETFNKTNYNSIYINENNKDEFHFDNTNEM